MKGLRRGPPSDQQLRSLGEETKVTPLYPHIMMADAMLEKWVNMTLEGPLLEVGEDF